MTILKEIEVLETKVKQDTISSKDFKLAILQILKSLDNSIQDNLSYTKKELSKKANSYQYSEEEGMPEDY